MWIKALVTAAFGSFIRLAVPSNRVHSDEDR